jgi:hypothetical protein
MVVLDDWAISPVAALDPDQHAQSSLRVWYVMSRRFHDYTKSDFGFQAYLGFLSLVLLGLGVVVYAVMQPTRLTNPGLAAYEAPAAVRALYPQPRTSNLGDEIVAAIFTPQRAADPKPTASTTGQSTRAQPASGSERKVGAQASDQRKSSKRAASRMRERQREAITSYARDYAPNYAPNYANNPEYGFRRMW